MPQRFTFKSTATGISDLDSAHWRSNSAPSEHVRDSELYPDVSPIEDLIIMPPPPVWAGRHAAASAQTLHGLGLTFPTAADTERPTTATRSGSRPRQKPNLRIVVKPDEDKPPPPPPKSPRHHRSKEVSLHSRNSSVQSRASVRAESPKIAQPVMVMLNQVKPTFVTQAAPARPSSRASGPRPPYANASANSSVSDLQDPSTAGRGRTKHQIQRKPIPVSRAAVLQDGTAPSSHSKLRAEAVQASPDPEGEKTPKAMSTRMPADPTFTPAIGALAAPSLVSETVANKTPDPPPPAPVREGTGSKTTASDDPSDKPPPTPMKDVFTAKAPLTRPAKPKRYYSKENGFSTPSPVGGPTRSPPTPPASKRGLDISPEAETSPLTSPDLRVIPKPPTEAATAHSSSSPLKSNASIAAPVSTNELQNRPFTPNILQDQQSDGTNRAPSASSEQARSLTEPSDAARRRAPTPELPIVPSKKSLTDPLEILQDLSKQSEALHLRYASLRASRQKISTGIVSSLKEQKAGPQYVNTMLDQHLALAAINSSMDICFAKLKSLDCRKEEAMSNLLAQQAAPRKRVVRPKMPLGTKSAESLKLQESGRLTPDLTAEKRRPKKAQSRSRSRARSRARKPLTDKEMPKLPGEDGKSVSRSQSRARSRGRRAAAEEQAPKMPTEERDVPGSKTGVSESTPGANEKASSDDKVSPVDSKVEDNELSVFDKEVSPIGDELKADEKRNTIIKSPPSKKLIREPEETSPVSPLSDPESEDNEDVEEQPKVKKIRIKGAKAVKILGLAQAADDRSGGPSITLPDGAGGHTVVPVAGLSTATNAKKLLPPIEVHISTSPLLSQYVPPPSPEPNKPLPSPPSARKNTNDSVSSSGGGVPAISDSPNRSGSSAESTPEEPEVQTPKEGREHAGVKTGSAEGAADAGNVARPHVARQQKQQVQAIHVLSDEDDDEILDYYSTHRPSAPGGGRPPMRGRGGRGGPPPPGMMRKPMGRGFSIPRRPGEPSREEPVVRRLNGSGPYPQVRGQQLR